MKVLFIWPGIYMGWNIIDKGFEQSAINHGLCAISAVLKSKDNICPMIDLRACAGWEHFESALKSQSDFDAAVMGFYSVDIQYATRAIQILKRNFPNRPVIVGGVHVTYGEFDSFSEADCVVWGEGDHITSDLLQILEAGRSIPSKLIAPMIDDLDSLPFIDRSLFNTECEQAHPLFPLLPVPYHTINFSRGCPWKCSFCFTEDMKVFTNKGLIRIKDIYEKDNSLKVQSHNNTFNKINKKIRREYKGIIHILKPTTICYPITCTPEHPFYIYDNLKQELTWKNAEYLSNNDYLTLPYIGNNEIKNQYFDLFEVVKSQLPQKINIKINLSNIKHIGKYDKIYQLRKQNYSINKISKLMGINRNSVNNLLEKKGIYKNTTEVNYIVETDDNNFYIYYHRHKPMNKKIKIDKEFCRLLGYYAAEGHLSRSNKRRLSVGVNFTISSKENFIKDDLVNLLYNYGKPFIYTNKKNNTYQIGLNNIAFYFICKELIGSGAKEKFISNTLLELPLELQKEFLIGYFRGDGNCGTMESQIKYWTVTSVSFPLIYGIWKIFTRFGIVANIFTRDKKILKSKVQNRDVSVNSIYQFFFSHKDIKSLEDIYQLEKFNKIKKSKNAFIDIENKLVCIKLKSNFFSEFEGYVYNFEIENTNTYNIFGINVHNCLESKNKLWKKYRTRNPEGCIEEIKRLDKIYGLGSLMIHDDHLPTGKWIYKFIELWDREIGKKVPFWCQIRADWICKYKDVIPEMKRMGLTWVSLGIEGSQRMLDFYDKRLSTEQVIRAASILHRNGVNIFGNYILGAPTETDDDIAELESIVARVRPQCHSPSIYTSYPGSLLFDYICDNDLWLEPIENGNNHYSMARFPFERKIKGIDYNKIFKIRNEWTQKYKGEFKT